MALLEPKLEPKWLREMYVTDRRPMANQLAYGKKPAMLDGAPRDHTANTLPNKKKCVGFLKHNPSCNNFKSTTS